MQRAWAVFGLGVILIASVGLASASIPAIRVAAIETLCKVGLPNLSRPQEVDAEELGCTVLGPLRTERGLHEGAFEHSMLVVGDRYQRGADGAYSNETAWLESAPGVGTLGPVSRPPQAPGHCFAYVTSVTVEGWMTLSEGGYGHLNGYSRAFYAGRLVDVSAVSPEQVAEMAPQSREVSCRWTGEAWEPIAAVEDGPLTPP